MQIMKDNIRKNAVDKKSGRVWKGAAVSAAASIAAVVLGGVTVFAGYAMFNRVRVNEEVLPELNTMEIVQVSDFEAEPDQYGLIHEDYSDYEAVQKALGIKMLDTKLSGSNPYMLCHIKTDGKDFAIITVDNYITGDTENYRYMEEESRYAYDNGKEYFTPVSLTIDLILSESQMENGWDTDYLGLYRFVENYTSKQGYRVNIVEDLVEGETPENYVSEKVAVFVADGIRYSLKGRVSVDTMKDIVNTME